MKAPIPCKSLTTTLLLFFALTGCVTERTLSYAGGGLAVFDNASCKPLLDEQRHPVTTPRHPAAYALLPFAFAADLPTLPFWIVITAAVNVGLIEPPF